MALESATYIDGLNAANPTGTDPKSQGDDHIRLLKSTVKATFPNISGAVTPTHTELNYVGGVTSAIQTQIDSKGAHAGQVWTGDHDFTGATPTVPTQPPADNSTKAASTAYVDAADDLKANIDSPALTGTPTAPTATTGTNTTQIATTAFVQQAAFTSALPNQTGNTGKFLTTDGSDASWVELIGATTAKSSNYTVAATDRRKAFALSSSATLSLPAAATAGDGFTFYVRNVSTGIWTIDPDGSETIDGKTTIVVYPGEKFAVYADGSAWGTIGRSRRVLALTLPTASQSSVAFESVFADPEMQSLDFEFEALLGPSGVNAQLAFRLKFNGSYVSTSNYSNAVYADAAFSSTSAFVSTSGQALRVTGRLRMTNPLANAANENMTIAETIAAGSAGGGQAYTMAWLNAAQTGPCQGIQFLFGSGFLAGSGSIRCYVKRD